ncbi:MAG: hypothetical protein ACPKQO_09750 [Nitrososphaeraceae archaeon]
MVINETKIIEILLKSFNETMNDIKIASTISEETGTILKQHQIENEIDFYIGYVIGMTKERFLRYASDDLTKDECRVAIPFAISQIFTKIDIIRLKIKKELNL